MLTNIFYLCDDNVFNFYGKPVITLTFYKIEIYSYGRYFKSLIQTSEDKIPDHIVEDPDKLIEWAQASKNVKDETGSVYVVSVSGGKMYKVKPGWEDYEALRDRVGNNKQLFQVISVDGNKLSYKSYTATGELFDAFDLIKNKNGLNSFIERKNEAL